VHPVAGAQPSTVHPLLSLQGSAGPPVHVPPTQVSLVVQAFASLHTVPFVLDGFEQRPVAGAHVPALWHWSGVGQITGDARHVPLWQASPVVQPLRSSQLVPFGLGTAEQAPVAGAQVPVLQPSVNVLQSTAVPPRHCRVAVLQVSLPSQALPLSQMASVVQPHPLESNTHPPEDSLQLSAVQIMPSSQTRAGPPQVPLVHVSGVVQARPSLQPVPFVLFGYEQLPVAGTHVPALWHWSGAGQTKAIPATQAPAWHASFWVHALLSLLHPEPFVLFV
jgi:hypothetical protein